MLKKERSDGLNEELIDNDSSSSSSWIKQRYVLVFLTFLGFFNVYAMRVNLSVAVVAMVNHTAENPVKNKSSLVCPIIDNTSTANPHPHHPNDGEFSWDESQSGLVLGCFFYGYVLTQYPGGRLSELYSGKMVMGIGILVTSVFTMLTPIAAITSFPLLITVRIIEGLGEGVTFPCCLAMLSKWAPKDERSKMTSWSLSGAIFGTVVSLPLSGVLIEKWGWPSVFYAFGSVGLVWCVFWFLLAYDTPDNHPWISEEERDYIVDSIGTNSSSINNPVPKTPWKQIFTSGCFWGAIATHMGQNFGFYVLLTELPTYMKDILNYDISQDGAISAFPYITNYIISVITSIIADWCIIKGCNRTIVRKTCNSIATFGPALAFIGAAYSGCNHILTITLLSLAVGTNGSISSGVVSSILEISPNFSGTIMGIVNAMGNIMGFVAPQVVGIIINKHPDLFHWKIVFWLSAAITTAGNMIFIIFGSSDEQTWNKVVVEDDNNIEEIEDSK